MLHRICLITAILLVSALSFDRHGAAAETHPVILWTGDTAAAVRARIDREPYAGWNARLADTATEIIAGNAGETAWLRAGNARLLATAYALRPDDPGSAEWGRQAALLLAAMPAGSYPGAFPDQSDLEISEAAADWATAYDTLAGAGYPFEDTGVAGIENTIKQRLASLRDYLSASFTPFSPSIEWDFLSAAWTGATHADNHHVKRYAALVLVSLAIPEMAGSGADLNDGESKLLASLDTMTASAPEDSAGVWAEGPGYHRYSFTEYCPALVALDHIGRVSFKSLADLTASHRWLYETVMPDGFCPPVDDNEAVVFQPAGLLYSLYPDDPDRGRFHWFWRLAGSPVQTAYLPEYLAWFDDTPPAALTPEDLGMPLVTASPEGGFARMRGGWDADDDWLMLLAEHGEARTGGQAHEHPDPNTLLYYTRGELMLIDSGYGGFSAHDATRFAENHNLVLVDGKGPSAASQPSGFGYWAANGVDAHITDAAAADRLAFVRAETLYENAFFTRTVLYVNNRFAYVFDDLHSSTPRTYTLLWHGNGGGTSGGNWLDRSGGGAWVRGNAGLRAHIAGTHDLFLDTTGGDHAIYARTPMLTHTVLRATQTAVDARFVSTFYPYAPDGDEPATEDAAVIGGGGALLAAGDDRSWGCARAGEDTMIVAIDGNGTITTDASFCHVFLPVDGSAPSRWFIADGTFIAADDRELARADAPAVIGLYDAEGHNEGFIRSTPGASVTLAVDAPFRVLLAGSELPSTRTAGSVAFALPDSGGTLRIEREGVSSAPAPPENVTFTEDTVQSGRSYRLAWSPPPVAAGSVTGYRIYRSRAPVPDAAADPGLLPSPAERDAWEAHAMLVLVDVGPDAASYVDPDVPIPGDSYHYWLQAVGTGGASLKTAADPVVSIAAARPLPLQLFPAVPNPFNAVTTLTFSLPAEGRVRLEVYDLLGRRCATLLDGIAGPGTTAQRWDGLAGGSPAASGTYLVRLSSDFGGRTAKILLLR